MPVTDPIADFLTRLRNGLTRHKDEVRVPSSKVVISVIETLQREGFVEGFKIVEGIRTKAQNDLMVRLKYSPAGDSVIRKLVRVSKPGRRIYMGIRELKPILLGLGIWVVSTPKGVMSDKEAREAKVGGEVLCRVE